MSPDTPGRGSIHDRMELAGDAVVHAEIEVAAFFDAEGELQYALRIDGDVPRSTVVGLLHMAADDVSRGECGE